MAKSPVLKIIKNIIVESAGMGHSRAERELLLEERARPATTEALACSALLCAANRIHPLLAILLPLGTPMGMYNASVDPVCVWYILQKNLFPRRRALLRKATSAALVVCLEARCMGDATRVDEREDPVQCTSGRWILRAKSTDNLRSSRVSSAPARWTTPDRTPLDSG